MAETKLREALAAFPGDDELGRLNEEYDQLEQAQALMRSTADLLSTRNPEDLESASAAIQAYQEVLRMVPGHDQAQLALNELAALFSKRASDAALRGNLEEAITLLDRASAASPELPDLELARERVQQATTLQAAISELLVEASDYRAAGAILDPPGANAAELYNRVLAADPSNVIAEQGLTEVTGQVTARVQHAAGCR